MPGSKKPLNCGAWHFQQAQASAGSVLLQNLGAKHFLTPPWKCQGALGSDLLQNFGLINFQGRHGSIWRLLEVEKANNLAQNTSRKGKRMLPTRLTGRAGVPGGGIKGGFVIRLLSVYRVSNFTPLHALTHKGSAD